MDEIEFEQKTSRTIKSIKAFKKELQKVKTQGMAINDHELEVGLCAIAVPILGHHGKAVAGAECGFFPLRDMIFAKALKEFAPALKNASRGNIPGSWDL